MSETPERFVALDLHKNYLVVGAVDQHHQVILPPHRISNDRFEKWAPRHLQHSDAVVMEATANAWYIHDLLEPLVDRVVVAHPYHVKLITASFIKTDKRDTLARVDYWLLVSSPLSGYHPGTCASCAPW